jgi:hypothetical protein
LIFKSSLNREMYVGEENMPEKTFYNEKLDAKAG